MRFALLASGSKGNAAVVEHRNNLILVDCGLSLRKIREMMGVVGSSISDITQVFLTHEHGDHIRGLERLSEYTGIKPHMTRGTAHQLGLGNKEYISVRSGDQCTLDDNLVVVPYTIPHDAREAVHYRFEAEGATLTFATDIGKSNDHVVKALSDSNALVLECNYDPVMLEGNPKYPPFLKERIRGGNGHLSNDQAAQLLAKVAHPKLRLVVAGHLSENNNTPALAKKSLNIALDKLRVSPTVKACPQGEHLPWQEVTPPS